LGRLKIKVISVRGNKITFDFTDEEANILFRTGLQLLFDKWFGHKVVVLPVETMKLLKTDKKPKTFEVSDEIEHLCIEEAVNEGLRNYLRSLENKKFVSKLLEEKPVKKSKK
jgi:hypothetical protein